MFYALLLAGGALTGAGHYIIGPLLIVLAFQCDSLNHGGRQ